MATIDVLLATYNGARFLPEQLSSLADQTFQDWRLIVRDDGSSDDTLAIIKQWAEQAHGPVRIIEDGRKGLGASGNFGALLEQSDAPYFAFCDQDDVWLPEKLDLMLKRVKAVEERCGVNTPVLAYSDLKVVDASLNEIHPSFRAYAPLVLPRPGRMAADLMSQNVVAGCASLGNGALRSATLPIPREAVMHDWWLAMTAAAIGEMVDVPESTLLYRQHGENAVGAVRGTFATVLRSIAREPGKAVDRNNAVIQGTLRQAQAVAARFGREAQNYATIAEYGELANRPFLARKVFALEHVLKPGTFLRNAAILIFI